MPDTKATGQLQGVEIEDKTIVGRGLLYRIGDPIHGLLSESPSPLTEDDVVELMDKLVLLEEVVKVWRSGPEVWVDATDHFEIPLPDRFGGEA